MNARTSVLLLFFAVCGGATVFALWPALTGERTPEATSLAVDSAARDAVSAAGAGAGSARHTELDATGSVAASAATRTRALVAADADNDETRPTAAEGCETEQTAAHASATARIAGAIRGSFVREGGPWTAELLPAENTVILDLSSIEHPSTPALRALTKREPGADGSVAWTFEFADVLEGEYLLTLSALGTRRWSPTSLRVRAPLDGVVFTRFDKDPVVALAFEVVDAQDGTLLPNFDARHIQVTPSRENGVFLHTGPLDLVAFPLDARFQWSLTVPGYATAFGDETAFVRRGDQKVAVVRLARGWATKVFVLTRDPTASAARGAEVRLDGVRAGFTGADGMLVVSAAEEPRAIDVELPGFVRPEGAESGGSYTPRQRGGVTVVMLDKKL
jgi:hypothetical protein